MTTVCAVARKGRVVMGADSMTNVYDRPVYGVLKVRRFPAGPGECLLGICGDGATADLLTAHLTIPTPPGDSASLQPWALSVAQAVTSVAIEYGILTDGRMDGSVLLGHAGHVWTLSHQQATPHHDGVAAIGSGEGPAIGAIDYGLERGDDNLESLIIRAVLIGMNRDRYSGGTATVETLP